MARRFTSTLKNVKPDDLLRCTICREWKPAAANFDVIQPYPEYNRAASYNSRCNRCMLLRGRIRTSLGLSRNPTSQEVRDHLAANKPVPVPVTLNTPNHPKRRTGTQSELERSLARDLREAREARRAAEGERETYVYCLGMVGCPDAVKIGITDDPAARPGELQIGNPWELRVLGVKQGTVEDERALHAKYIQQNMVGEWFRPTKELLSEFGLEWEVLTT